MDNHRERGLADRLLLRITYRMAIYHQLPQRFEERNDSLFVRGSPKPGARTVDFRYGDDVLLTITTYDRV
jgi:hypothetical protein